MERDGIFPMQEEPKINELEEFGKEVKKLVKEKFPGVKFLLLARDAENENELSSGNYCVRCAVDDAMLWILMYGVKEKHLAGEGEIASNATIN